MKELIVVKLKKPCSCMDVIAPAPLAPGQSVDLQMFYNPAGKSGQQRSIVNIFTNDLHKPSFNIPVIGYVVDGKLDLGTIASQNSESREFRVRYISEDPAMLMDSKLSGGIMDVEMDTTELGQSQHEILITLNMKKDIKIGAIKETLEIEVVGQSWDPQMLTFSISGVASNGIDLKPSSLNFGFVSGGTKSTRKVVLEPISGMVLPELEIKTNNKYVVGEFRDSNTLNVTVNVPVKIEQNKIEAILELVGQEDKQVWASIPIVVHSW